MVTPVKLPTIRPPTDRDKFDSVTGYEWADRITAFLKVLTDTLDTIINNPVNPPGFSSPLTTKGDVWGFTTVNARIPVGTNGQVLTADSTQALGVKWGPGFTSPLTTLGDIYVRNATQDTRMPIGVNGQVLTADSTQVNGMKWATATGGGGTLQGQEFTTSGTFTWPTGVTSAWISMIGGGSGGSGSLAAVNNPGCGGGSGEYVVSFPVAKVGPTVSVVVGTKGLGGAATANGTSGGDSSFGFLVCKAATAGVDRQHSGAGGGITGNTSKALGGLGAIGAQASPLHFGGSSGGSATNLGGAQPGGIGGGTGGYPGVAGGAAGGGNSGGGSGASSPWGPGGAGGTGTTAGNSAASTSYGAGGGGAGGASSVAGGDACAGYCLVTWIG